MPTRQPIVIIGVGETAEMAKEYFDMDSNYEVVAFAAQKDYISKNSLTKLMSLPIVAIENLIDIYPPSKYKAFVALSYEKLNHVREKFYVMIKKLGYELVSYISKKAIIGANVSIGDNCLIMENNVIQRNVSIGNNVILWSGNHIGHKTHIGDNVFFSSHVAVSGFCRIGDFAFLGINSCIGDCVNIAECCFIGAGVTIVQDTKKDEFYRLQKAEPERLSGKKILGY